MKVFIHRDLKKQLAASQLEALKKDFINYKNTGVLPDNFGRDVLYDHPYTPRKVLDNDVWHLHLKTASVVWPPYFQPYQRTSDDHLVYCQGMLHDDHYLFIALLTPDAHQLARNANQMWRIGDLAERFRLEH